MHSFYIKVAAYMGALSVAIGAFAAHQLKAVATAEVLQIFETAVRYQFYHVFALLATGILLQTYQNKQLKWAANSFIAGIVLFSGSLYVLCVIKHFNPMEKPWIGAVTPLGGVCFIAGWLLLAIGLANKSKPLS